jgi:two-component system, NtrC family, sensor kinase
MTKKLLTLRSRVLLIFAGVAILAGIASAWSGVYLIYFIFFALLLIAAVVFYRLLSSFLKPLNELRIAVEDIAAGPNLREIRISDAPPEIRELVESFNRMQAVIRERRRVNQEKLLQTDRLATIGQLAAGVAHEINNPLGSILLLTRLVMQQSTIAGKARENLERIEKETKRCHSIVQSLLDFARQREPNISPVDVNSLLDATIKMLERQYLFQNIEIVRRYSAGLSPVQADQLQIQQVFINIIINAADSMNGKGILTLETIENDPQMGVEIGISDTGCGIPPQNIARIFDPFFTTKDVGRGTGLGLSVSYGIIQAHHGEIKVTSDPGKGSKFTITLPILKEVA